MFATSSSTSSSTTTTSMSAIFFRPLCTDAPALCTFHKASSRTFKLATSFSKFAPTPTVQGRSWPRILRRQRRKRWSRQCQRQSLRANDEDISGDGDDDDDNERKRILSSRRVGQTRVCQRQRVLNAIFQINGTGRDTKTENGKGCASNVSCVVVQRVSFLLQVLYVSLYLSLGVFRVSLFLSFSKCCACERQSRALLLLFFLLVPGFLFLVRHLWRDPPLLRTQNNTFRLVVYLESRSQLHFFESPLREKLVGRSWIFSF